MNKAKKVVLAIVEGASDELALGAILNHGIKNSDVVCVIMRGDITSESGINSDNIVKTLNTKIQNKLDSLKYKTSDILRIIHIVDLDGAFVNEDAIKEKDTDNFEYTERCIYAKRRDSVIRRNLQKTELLKKLRQTGKINRMLYRVYYNSCNLEHVLYNELHGFTDEEKMEKAYEFVTFYSNREGEFIDKLGSMELKPCATYKECWDYAEEKNNSLKRHSNMYFIFNED